MFSKPCIDFNDYEIDKLNYKVEGETFNLATSKKTGEKVRIQLFHAYDEFKEKFTKIIKMFDNSMPGICKLIDFYIPNEQNHFNINLSDKLGKSIEITSDNFIIITEFNQYYNLEKMTSEYHLTEGKNSLLDSTIRSKIIFGVASIIKQLHAKGIFGIHLKIDDVYLDKKFEPHIGNFGMLDAYLDIVDMYMTIKRGIPYEEPPEMFNDENKIYTRESDVYNFAIFLYRMFSPTILLPSSIYSKSYYSYIQNFLLKGRKPSKPKNIPAHYWELIEKCWPTNPYDRISFDEIVDILSDDKFALNEYDTKTNLDELHEYQKRINNSNENVDELRSQVEDFKSLLSFSKRPKDMSKCIIDNDDEKSHNTIEKVGEGATSFTYKIFDKKTNRLMCKKILKFTRDQKNAFQNLKNLIKEFEVLNSLNHPCICEAISMNMNEILKDPNVEQQKESKEKMTTVAIFLEFLDYKLSDVLKSKITNTLKARIVIEIIHAMIYIHKHGLIHRDLKIDNIMLNSVFNTKLVDFGLVRIHEILDTEFSYVNDSLTKGVGTFAYMSPEMLNSEDYDYKTDVYSFGVVLYYIFLGKLPDQNLRDKLNGKLIKLPSESSKISKFCIRLLKKCLATKPSNRPSFEEILEEIRDNDYSLAPFIDVHVISQRDHELEIFEKYNK